MGANLKEIKKINNCSCIPVANDKHIFIATMDLTIKCLDINTLELIHEIDLKPLKEVREEAHVLLFLTSERLFIQIQRDIYSMSLTENKPEQLTTIEGIAAINNSVQISDSIYYSAIIKNKNAIESINLKTGEKKLVKSLEDTSKFILATDQNLFFTENGNVICYDVTSKQEKWRTPLSASGNYKDELWNKEVSGEIDLEAVLVNNQLIAGVQKSKVASLDTGNGTIKWVSDLGDNTNAILIRYEESDASFHVFSNDLFEIDLNGKIVRTILKQSDLDQKGFSPGKFGSSSDYFYITTTYRKPALLVVDKKNGTLIESHELEIYSYYTPIILGKYLVLWADNKDLIFFRSN